MNALVQIPPSSTNAELYRASTDAAALCREIVLKTAQNIQGRKYVKVEGWQAIAIAHGCTAGARDVEKVDGGVRAIGEVRRMSDGGLIATAEGFVGEDEPTWYGGKAGSRTLPKRADYAIRAMAQTRAISRACRSAFAHVVVMIDAGLSTTPAEEVPHGGFDDHNGHQVIDQEAQQRGPAPRSKLDGPHASKTALKTAVHLLASLVREAATVADLNGYLKQGADTIAQAERDWPELLTGDPGIAEDIGLKGLVQLKRAELKKPRGMLEELIDSMKLSENKVQLDQWFDRNEPALDGLSGHDRRLFDIEMEDFEAGLSAVATVNAG